MLNQVAVEALYSATYVENYLDCVENLPDDLQRHLSRMRDVDAHYRECLRAVNADLNQALATKDERNYKKRAKAIERIKTSLINAQEYGDEKLQIVQLLQDLIDHKSRQLDIDYRNLVSCLDYGNGNSVKEEAMAVDAPSVKEPVSAGGGAGGSAAQQGVPSASGGQGGAPRTPASPPHNHDRDRERTEKDRTGERASKRARRSRNDTATGNEHERSSGCAGGVEGRTSGVEREPPAPAPPPPPPPPDPPQRNVGGNSSNKKAGTGKLGTGKKKKRKCRQSAQNNQRDETPPPEDPDPIDPDEPTYCLCDQISFGEMILCDNDLCPIEWFHFSCVSLSTKPKGKWFCPKCRGDRPNVMKPKSQFLKELERYNKEKEEKA